VLPIRVEATLAVDIDTITHLRIGEEILAAGEFEVVRPAAANSHLLSPVRLLVFDFDGVFTDNRVYVDQSGVESVICSRSDGFGIERLLAHGLDAVVLSTETNLVVAARCRKLKIPAHQGLRDKGQALRHLVSAKGLTMNQVAYIGNDVNDLECLRIAGVAVA